MARSDRPQYGVTADEATAEGYQNRALECFALADEVFDPHESAELLHIAMAYMRLAERSAVRGRALRH